MVNVSLGGALKASEHDIASAGGEKEQAGIGKEQSAFAEQLGSSSSGVEAQTGGPTIPPPHIMDLPPPIQMPRRPGETPIWRYGRTCFVHGGEDVQKAFNDARTAIAASGERGQKVLTNIESANVGSVRVIGCSYNRGDKFLPITERLINPVDGSNIERIRWAINQSVMATNGAQMPPAAALYHELSHAVNRNRDMLTAIKMGMFTNAEERRVIGGPERDFLLFYKLRPRDTHGPLAYYQSSGGVLSRQASDPGVEEILQKHEPNLTRLSARADSFGVDRSMSNPPAADRSVALSDIRTGDEALAQLKYEMRELQKELDALEKEPEEHDAKTKAG